MASSSAITINDLRSARCCSDHEICCLKQEIKNLVSDRRYYVSPEICREITHVDNGLSHLKLGSTLLYGDRNMKTFTPSEKLIHEHGAYRSLVSARNRLENVRHRMAIPKITYAMDLGARQAHHDMMNDLHCIQKDMKSYVHNTLHRLDEYCSDIGVSDRFTGYRNSMNLGIRDPLRCHSNFFIEEEDYCDCNNVNQEPKCCPKKCSLKCCPRKLIQEEFGINMRFPGISEYTDNFVVHEKLPLFKFNTNPTPNYDIDGKQMAMRVKLPSMTNYSENFVWPEECKLPLYPWIRK